MPKHRQQAGYYDSIQGKRYYLKSKGERLFAQWLDFLYKGCVVVEWWYEEQTFWFEGIRRGTVSYKPDFNAYWPDEGMIYYEIKGNRLTSADITKFKRMKKYHPNTKVVLVLPRPPKSGKLYNMYIKAKQYVDGVLFLNQLGR